MAFSLSTLSAEFFELRARLDQLTESLSKLPISDGDVEASREAAADDMGRRMASLSRAMVQVQATSPRELVRKAQVVIDWLDEDGDLASALARSLCHDVVQIHGCHSGFCG